MKPALLSLLLIASSCWAGDACKNRGITTGQCYDSTGIITNQVGGNNIVSPPSRLIPGDWSNLTTRWINDEANSVYAKCEAEFPAKKAEVKARRDALPRSKDGFSAVWINDPPNCYKPDWIGVQLPDGSRMEFGFRSDGVMVWREAK